MRIQSRALTRAKGRLLVLPLAAALALSMAVGAAARDDPNQEPFLDPSGEVQTITSNGFVDTQNAFFQSLGTNGRSCATCHAAGDGWTITPPHVAQRFFASQGLDPLFRPVDGAVSPDADVSTLQARRAAYAMLLTKGLIRVGIGIPAGAEFSLVAVDDPYHVASADQLSLFRRPLPATNLRFLSTVMWDGRESTSVKVTDLASLEQALMNQANDATLGHAQAAQPLSPEQRRQIADFELGLTTAQVFDFRAGDLTKHGAQGGPQALSNQAFFIGINDPLGQNPTGAPFDPRAMTQYDAWASLHGDGSPQAAVARGQALFDTKPLQITGVGGLNDVLKQATIQGTCTTCHDTPNVGNHSVAAPLNIGTADAGRRTPDMPLYTLRNNATGETVQTTDPGRALITGKWADVGKFKGPVLRGLAARAPYFHNGSAATLSDVVDFYNARFNVGFTPQEKSDLIAFLRTL